MKRPFSFFPAKKIFSFLSNDIAIDLGTANTLVYVRNRGIVLDEPSVVAVKANTNQVLAAGKEAKEMLGKTPESIVACRPMRDGVIANFELTESMLRYFIRAVNDNRRTLVRPRMIIGVPRVLRKSSVVRLKIRQNKQVRAKSIPLWSQWRQQLVQGCLCKILQVA